MEADASLWSLNVALGVLLVDILLSGDNAIVIALVCRTLSSEHRTKALCLGVLGAFVARLVLTSCATLAMNLPLIKLVGGVLLLKISIELIVDNDKQAGRLTEPLHSSESDVFSAARTIVLADIVMSLDNVLALSALTQNNWQMLTLGLLLSIPILMFGSLYLSRLLEFFPHLLWVGGAVLGGVSGALIVDDPVFAGALNNASSVAPLVVPLLAAGFVVQISRVIASNARRMQPLGRPPSLLSILWKETADPAPSLPQREPRRDPAAAASTPIPHAAEPEPEPEPMPEPGPRKPVPMPAGSGGEYRIVFALGLFMLLSGGILYYMLNVYAPSVPNHFITYACKQPAMTISYMPEAHEIRFATSKGVLKTTVIEERIVWDDYREAGSKLGLPPPVKIMSADARKLVVNGGMFDNTACFPTAQQ